MAISGPRGSTFATTATLAAGRVARKLTPEKAYTLAANFCKNSKVFDVETLVEKARANRIGLAELQVGVGLFCLVFVVDGHT